MRLPNAIPARTRSSYKVKDGSWLTWDLIYSAKRRLASLPCNLSL